MTTIKTDMPIRHGARWNDSEQSRLYDQSQNNLSLEAIADLHQRSVVSILLKQKALGLRDENDELLKPIPSSDGLSMNYIQPVNREDNLPSKVSKQGGVNHSLLSVKPIGGADKAIKASIQKSTSPDASLSVQKPSVEKDMPHQRVDIKKLRILLRHDPSSFFDFLLDDLIGVA